MLRRPQINWDRSRSGCQRTLVVAEGDLEKAAAPFSLENSLNERMEGYGADLYQEMGQHR